jgi:hypothetical protein
MDIVAPHGLKYDKILTLVSHYKEKFMPTISTFYGIIIQMFFDDHVPPHFHAKYAEFKAI